MVAGSLVRRLRGTLVVMALVSATTMAVRADAASKLSLTVPVEGAWVGVKFTVRGALSGAPRGAVVRSGDLAVPVGDDGAFEFPVTADREGERRVHVTYAPTAGPPIEVVRTVKVDATPPAIGSVSPSADLTEYAGDTAVVSGRFMDLTALSMLVNGVSAPIDANGRFSVALPVPAEGEGVVRIAVTDAAGNAAPAVVRRLARWKDRGPVSMSLEEKGAVWVARDGKRVPLTGAAKKDAETIASYEAPRGPLAPADRPLLVSMRTKGAAVPFAVPKAMNLLRELPVRVSIVAPPAEPSNAKAKADVADVIVDPKDGAIRVRCAEKEWAFVAADVAALSDPKADSVPPALRGTVREMGTSLQFLRKSLVVRIRMPQPVDARFLDEICASGFRGADLILESTEAPGAPSPTVVPVGPPAPLKPTPAPVPAPTAAPEAPLLRRGAFTSLRSADQAAITAALAWLVAHQSPDGSWSVKDAIRWCDGKVRDIDTSHERGHASYDVGVTGLSLLALLGGGHAPDERGPIGAALTAGLRYLTTSQDAEGGYGQRLTNHHLYCHGIATTAMVEAFGVSNEPVYGASAQRALDLIAVARNPYFAWRYGIKPGDNDTSMTGWMVGALEAARKVNAGAASRRRPAPFVVDDEALEGALAWAEKMTDPTTGRAGYQQRGTGPARPMELIDAFPSDQSEAMTAITLMIRTFGAKSKAAGFDVSYDLGMGLLAALRPTASSQARDMYYWYYGTIAMRIAGKKYEKLAKDWDAGVRLAVTDTQVKMGTKCETKGSWDPDDVWSADGGRVYATAICTLILETPVRYP